MSKKAIALLMAGCMVGSMVAPAGTVMAQESDLSGTKITFLNTKTEIQDYLEDMGAAFKEETGIEVEFYTNTEENHITEKYAAGEPYTIMMMDYPDVADYQEYLYDLSGEKWIGDGGSQYGLTLDGKVYGFPFVIEAMGLIYNADAIEKITGETFNWEDYSNLEAFKGLLDKLVEGGMESPVALNQDDWSLASHVFGQAYCAREDGSEDDPLSATYDMNDEYLKEGTVAFWPNGSWATDVSELTDNVGIMPYPMDTKDEVNAHNLVSGATKMLAVDAAYSSEDEQKAALEFLNWLVYSDYGQKFMVNTCSLITAFSNNTQEPEAALSASVASFVKNGSSVYWYQAMPSDHNTVVGAILQKYISGDMDRDELISEVSDYWKNHE